MYNPEDLTLPESHLEDGPILACVVAVLYLLLMFVCLFFPIDFIVESSF